MKKILHVLIFIAIVPNLTAKASTYESLKDEFEERSEELRRSIDTLKNEFEERIKDAESSIDNQEKEHIADHNMCDKIIGGVVGGIGLFIAVATIKDSLSRNPDPDRVIKRIKEGIWSAFNLYSAYTLLDTVDTRHSKGSLYSALYGSFCGLAGISLGVYCLKKLDSNPNYGTTAIPLAATSISMLYISARWMPHWVKLYKEHKKEK